jgi:hypothetical protein
VKCQFGIPQKLNRGFEPKNVQKINGFRGANFLKKLNHEMALKNGQILKFWQE